MKTNAEGVALIKREEGLVLHAYKCPANVWTIGYGHTGDVEPDHVITEHQADIILSVDLEKYERGVAEMTKGCQVTSNQFSALVSLAFNIGLARLRTSRLMKYVRAGRETPNAPWAQRAADEFLVWKYAAGRVLPGLERRRQRERALFLKADGR